MANETDPLGTPSNEEIAALHARIDALEKLPPPAPNAGSLAPPSLVSAALEARITEALTILRQLLPMQQTQTASLTLSDAERARRAAADERQREWIKLISLIVAAAIGGIEIWYRGASK